MAGRPEKRAETAPAHTDIGIIDVAVDNIGDKRLRMLFQPNLMGHCAERVKIGVTVKIPCLIEI
ncbi:hypothetical protein SBDP1_320053 [Syntrophobacter sp. SbD1]|nr:hypothetical protein SBDP1_320053 [Syntrophobacter sp. SbD1]